MPDDTNKRADLTTMEQIDEVCELFEQQWQSGKTPKLEKYLATNSQLNQQILLRHLLELDIDYRSKTEADIDREDYLERFPDFKSSIEDVFSSLDETQKLKKKQRLPAGLGQFPNAGKSDDTMDFDPTTTVGGELPTAESREKGYTILKEHARGGLGKVSVARDHSLRRDVAVKEIRSDRWSTMAQQRFVNEAEITGQLEHPGIVPVYSLDEDEHGKPYYVMRFIEGQTMADEIRNYHREPNAKLFNRLLGSFVDLCQALGYAHSKHIIHRDLKPANVMLGQFGETLVLDWGLARRVTENDAKSNNTEEEAQNADAPELTQLGEVLGTPAYMAPEQAQGEGELDARCDVFGLGAILCTILTGKPPFLGADMISVVKKAAAGDLTDAFERLDNASAEPELVEVAKRCLAADKSNRPSDASKVAEAIIDYQSRVQENLRKAEIQRAEAQARASEERRRRKIAIALALVVVLLLATAGIAWRNYHQDLVATQFDVENLVQNAGQHLTEAESESSNLVQVEKRLQLAGTDLSRAKELITRKKLQLPAQFSLAVSKSEMRLTLVKSDNQLLLQFRAFDEKISDLQAGVDRLEPALLIASDALEDWGATLDGNAWKSTVEKIRSRPQVVQQAIADYLQVCFVVTISARGEIAPTSWVVKVLDEIDQSPSRNTFREHLLQGRLDEAGTLLINMDIADQPAKFIASTATWLNEGNPQAARKFVRRAVVEHPRDFLLACTAGRIYLKDHVNLQRKLLPGELSEVQESARYYSSAVAMRPDSAVTRYHLGLALGAAGDKVSELSCYRKTIAIDPNMAFAHTNIGNLLRRQGDFDGALKSYQTALNIDAELHEAHLNLGVLHHAQGDFESSINAYREALKFDADGFAIHFNLGISLQESKQFKQAVEEFRKAIQWDDSDEGAWVRLGIALLDLEEYEEATKAFEKVLELNPKSDSVHRKLAWAYFELGDSEKAKKAYEQAVIAEPENADSHFRLAELMQIEGNLDRAIELYRQGLVHDPDNTQALLNTGSALRAQGKLDEAKATFKAAIAKDADFPEAHYNLGVVLNAQKDVKGAAESFSRAADLRPSLHPALYSSANSLLSIGELDRAETAFRKIIQINPAHAEAHCNLGSCLKRQGKFKESLEFYTKGHKLGSNRANWRYPSSNWVRNGQRLVELDEALAAHRSGTQPAENATSKVELASFAFQDKKDYPTALQLYEAAFKQQPALVATHRYVAACSAIATAEKTADDLSDEEGLALRQKALAWLEADLQDWKTKLQSNPQQATAMRQVLARWLRDETLSGVRDSTKLSQVPEPQRQPWLNLWTQVRQLISQNTP